ncbi:MAG: T4 RnlA family RNA ligase [Hydrogenophaga sp.]|uniref:RNA ligase n=1 Tax=Hydrogenophaga sp. TaxID=1904254 RepID=UPI002618F996|nr:RNA ligase [Hydrogenophaga sp.]MCV0439828.1 T4 RnlA family RNA ligase [Hydrogenophaga sp.]
MKDPILLNKLWKEVEAGRVTVMQSGSLSIFKYTQETHIKDLWNDVNRQARGIIFDVDGTVVARPFSKFFNLHERAETERQNLPWDEGVEIFEKLDGSCGTGYFGTKGPSEDVELPIRTDATYHPPLPMWRLATPGSMESEQALEGTRILHEREAEVPFAGDHYRRPLYELEHLPTDCTPVFEIIYPENRIVVDYHGARELVLLAIFEHNGEEWHPRRVDMIAELCGFRRPERYDIDIRGEVPFEDNHEGYVCRFGNGFRVKVKSPVYLRIHRLLNHLSPKGVVELIRGKEYGTTVSQLPKEIAKDFDDVRAHVQGIYNDFLGRAYTNYNNLLKEVGINQPRKAYAEWVIANVPNMETGFVFALLDDKDIEDRVWKLVLETVQSEAGPRTVEVA